MPPPCSFPNSTRKRHHGGFSLLEVLATRPDSFRAWTPKSRWVRLPKEVAVAPETNRFLTSGSSGARTACAQSGAALAKLDGAAIGSFSDIVFRPDGRVDAPVSTQPVRRFRRLKTAATTGTETALVLSPGGCGWYNFEARYVGAIPPQIANQPGPYPG